MAAVSLSFPAASLTSPGSTPGGRAGRLSTESTLISSQKWDWPAVFTSRRTACASRQPKGCVLVTMGSPSSVGCWHLDAGAEGRITEPKGLLVFNTGCVPEAACADLSVSATGGRRRAHSVPRAPPVVALQDPGQVFISFPEIAHGPRVPAQSRRQPDLYSGGPSIVCGCPL